MTPSRIKALRRTAGWTQADLARRLHVQPHSVYRYEAGLRKVRGPVEKILEDLCRRYGV